MWITSRSPRPCEHRMLPLDEELPMASKFSALLGSKDGTVLLQYLAEAAYLWSYLGKPDEAKAIFEGLQLLAPADPVAPLGLAEIYLSEGKFREADKAAELATK